VIITSSFLLTFFPFSFLWYFLEEILCNLLWGGGEEGGGMKINLGINKIRLEGNYDYVG
jgi:hypothetical protein